LRVFSKSALIAEGGYLLIERGAEKIIECLGNRWHGNVLDRFRFIGNIILPR
jgi:hypothetical protein